jgi:hypothetical protein
MSADIAGHGDDGKDRDASAQSLLMNFAPQVEQRGVSANAGAYRSGKVVREVVHDDFPGERRGGNGFEQAKIVERVSRRFGGAEHRGLAGVR